MASPILPTLLYLTYAGCFYLFCGLLGLDSSAEMFHSVTSRFTDTPWAQNPVKTVFDVRSGAEVFEWMQQVVLNQIYRGSFIGAIELPSSCTIATPCLIGEDVADVQDKCARYLSKGQVNCPSNLGVNDCCEPCQDNCEHIPIKTSISLLNASTSVDNLAANCMETLPSWLPLLRQWPQDASAADFKIPDPSSDSFAFCPERISKLPQDRQADMLKRPPGIRIDRSNQLLMGRITLKRINMVEFESDRFNNAYRSHMEGGQLSADRSNANEDRNAFGSEVEMHQYQHDGGYMDAGGFVQYLDFGEQEHSIRDAIARIHYDQWFDLRQGTFVLELLLWNGFYDRFLHLTFVFTHDFSGQTSMIVEAKPLNMVLLMDASSNIWILRLVLELFIICLFFYFLKTEIDAMTADFKNYFSNFMLLLHIASLFLSFVSIIMFMVVVFSYDYQHIEFPLPRALADKIEFFDDVVHLAQLFDTLMRILAVNICIISTRCITLVAYLTPHSSVVFNTIVWARTDLISFVVMFLVIFIGFTFAMFYLLGTKSAMFGSWPKSFVGCLKMIMGVSNYDELNTGDAVFGDYFFFGFHLLFVIIQNMLLSIICRGYAIEKAKQSEPGQLDNYPLKRTLRALRANFREYTASLMRFFATAYAVLFTASGGGGAHRINEDQVNYLRDKRSSSNVRLRQVRYDRKQEDYSAPRLPVNDLVLKPMDPYYTRGMMHFYVAETKPDGPALERRVLKGFRLIGIKTGGMDQDRKEFRSEKKFKDDESKGGYGGKPEKILEGLIAELFPITLEFEGCVKPFSCECFGQILFIVSFTVFVVLSSRIAASYDLAAMSFASLERPQWTTYNPERLMNYSEVKSTDDIGMWTRYAAVDGLYADIRDIITQQQMDPLRPRPDFVLYAGVEGSERVGPYGGVGVKTGAVDGLSIGYIPFDVQSEYFEQQRSFNYTGRRPVLHERNIGFMPNNHVRATWQVACYIKNPSERFAAGTPQIISPVITNSPGCANDVCMQKMMNSDEICLDVGGSKRDPRIKLGMWSKINYTYVEKGTFGELGGFAVGFGATLGEAQVVLRVMQKDQFVQDATSLVLEFVTYNGYVDLFTYTSVEFSVKATGIIDKSIYTSVFPLDIFSMGPGGLAQEGQKTMIIVFFVFYLVCFLGFVRYFLNDLWIQYRISREMKRNKALVIPDFFLEDWWNFTDVAIIVLNVCVLYNLSHFLMVEGIIKYPIESWTLDFEFNRSTTIDTADPFENFALAGRYYSTYMGFCAISAWILYVRLVKYMTSVPQMRVIIATWASAFFEIVFMVIILVTMQLGFAWLFYFEYGMLFKRFGTFNGALTQLFLFICGKFLTEDLMHHSPIFFITCFSVYQFIFYFLLANMFLAAVTHQWKVTRQDAQDGRTWFRSFTESQWLASCPCAKRRRKESDVRSTKKLVMLDNMFWREHAVLNFLGDVNEKGQVSIDDKAGGRLQDKNRAMEGNEEFATGGHHAPHASASGSDGGEEAVSAEDHEAIKKLERIFKQAHMEMASMMCRHVDIQSGADVDQGAGVAMDLLDQPEAAAYTDDEGMPIPEGSTVQHIQGIIEDEVPEDVAVQIRAKLEQGFKEDYVLEEIWLDAVVTVLEECDVLGELQNLFRPATMIRPRTPQDVSNFYQKKVKMERRLELFLNMLREETKRRHYKYLKDSARTKVKVLKQQSLVLADYLEQLNARIKELQEEIKRLERRNAQMRSHVSPLL